MMKVIRQNHIGDSPHTMAYVIAGLLHDTDNEPVTDWMETIKKWYQIGYKYPEIRKQIGLDLQEKKQDSVYFTSWQHVSALTINEHQHIYNQLSIKLSGKDICGESFYYGFPQLTLGDYIRITKVFRTTCTMTFPCLGDLQALSMITDNSIGGYISGNTTSQRPPITYNKPIIPGNENTIFTGSPIRIDGIIYKPDMMICNDGYYRYYDREYNESFDINENSPLNDAFFKKNGKCKWGNYTGK